MCNEQERLYMVNINNITDKKRCIATDTKGWTCKNAVYMRKCACRWFARTENHSER